MKEIFKDIESFEGRYQISNFGRVWSIKNEMFLTPRMGKWGYLYLILRIDKKKYTKKIHRLVAEAFIENPNKKPHINHLDGIKNNNYFKNLEWVTPSENRFHAYRTGLQKPMRGENHAESKLSNLQVEEIRKLYKLGNISYLKISKIYGVSYTTIADIICNRKYKIGDIENGL